MGGRSSASGGNLRTDNSEKSSIANPIYDVAVIVTLLVPMGAGVAVANRRFLFTAVLCICLVMVDLAAIFVGRLCQLPFREYLKSMRSIEGRTSS